MEAKKNGCSIETRIREVPLVQLGKIENMKGEKTCHMPNLSFALVVTLLPGPGRLVSLSLGAF
jgi:hypothetical protein